jgi:hypothetical protein
MSKDIAILALDSEAFSALPSVPLPPRQKEERYDLWSDAHEEEIMEACSVVERCMLVTEHNNIRVLYCR